MSGILRVESLLVSNMDPQFSLHAACNSVCVCVLCGGVFFSFDPEAAHSRAAPRRLPSLPQKGCVLQSHPVQDGLPEMD